uniref:C6 domain-containing protein n=1 Tax=Plectus sambesii TaxID=2011161 RepID=A0A914VLR9_9BILA
MISWIIGLVFLWMFWLPNNRACMRTIPGDDLTTTTTAPMCPDPMPLFATPDGFVKVVIPAANTNGATTPAGTTISVACDDAGTNPATVGAGLTVTFDTIGTNIMDGDNLNGSFEEFSLTCEPTGLWLFDITGITGGPGPQSYSGIVSAPGAALCQACLGPVMPWCQ